MLMLHANVHVDVHVIIVSIMSLSLFLCHLYVSFFIITRVFVHVIILNV